MLLLRLVLAHMVFLWLHMTSCANLDNGTWFEGVREEHPLSNNQCRFDVLDSYNTWFRVVCDTPDTLDTLPTYPAPIPAKVLVLVIKNQPRFRYLNGLDMARYPALAELTITHTGLEYISPMAFSKNKHLKKLDLRSNELKSLDWRAMVGLRDTTLDVIGNPLICNCSLFWLAAWSSELANKRNFASPDGTEFFISTTDAMTLPKEILHLDMLECIQNSTGAPVRLTEWRYSSSVGSDRCSLPMVQMTPKILRASSGALERPPAQFECSISSTLPLDLEFRQTFQLKVTDLSGTRNRISITKTIHNPGLAQFNLTLPTVTSGQMGWYVCVGLSASGPSFDMAALVVDSKPRVKLLAQNRTWQLDHYTDTFDFMIQAYPPPTSYAWLKNNSSINFTEEAVKHAFSVIDAETAHLRSKGFFYVSRVSFRVQLRYRSAFYEGHYGLETCNMLGCGRMDFASYDQSSFPVTPALNVNQTGHIVAVDSRSGLDHGWIIAVILMCVGSCMFGLGSLFYFVRGKACTSGRRRWMRSDPAAHGPSGRRLIRNGGGGAGGNGHMLEAASVQLSSYTSNAVYEPLLSASVPLIPRESVQIVRTLGEGAFGQVHLAYCKLNSAGHKGRGQDKQQQHLQAPSLSGSKENEEPSLVAAKTLKRFSLDRSQEVAREAELMAKLNHPNIVTFYGVSVNNEDDLLLLYEYMELGDLKRFLALHGPNPELASDDYATLTAEETWRLSDTQLIDIARQVARGLTYLHENHFVHRDLASRNCLVKTPLHVKLSDFGMTRDIYSSDYYRLTHKAPLPVRWLPPESLLYGRFSNLSDIWSYGVVVWEIATYGKQPWYEYSNVEVMQRVNNGDTLTPPPECHEVLRQVMLDCWKRTPNERVKLGEIIERLSSAL